MRYYTLVVKEGNQWVIAFGDYDRKWVVCEKQDSYKGVKSKIITTSDKQSDIDNQVRLMNMIEQACLELEK